MWHERWLHRFLPPRWALNLLPAENTNMHGHEHRFRLANEGMPLPAFQFFDVMLYVQLERGLCTFVADLSVISEAQLALLRHCFARECAALAVVFKVRHNPVLD